MGILWRQGIMHDNAFVFIAMLLPPNWNLLRWGKCSEAVKYYAEHVTYVLLALDSEGTVLIDTVKTVACETSMKNE